MAEECCSECKDGGEDLRVCDYPNCLKSYHPYCTVRREGDDFPPGEQFICKATPPVVDSFDVLKQKLPKGATMKMAHSYLSNVNEESSEVASKQGDATCEVAEATREVAFEAGEAFSSGVTPDTVLHSPVAQDSSNTQAIDIDKDESNHTKHNKSSNLPVHEVINLDSTDEEEEDHDAGHETVHPPGAMNCGDPRMEQPESVWCAALHAQGDMYGFHRECEAACAIGNGMPRDTYLWYYADPKGDSKGSFLLVKLWECKMDGYFDEGFKVWRAGQGRADKERRHFA